MVADLEQRLARLEPARRKARNAAAWRYGLIGATAIATFAAMIVASTSGALLAAWFLEDGLRGRPWLAVPIFLVCGALPVVPGAIAGFLVYRRVGWSWRDDYERQFLAEIVQPLAHAAAPFARVAIGDGIPIARYEACALFPPTITVTARFRVDGAARGVEWAAGDAHATTWEQTWEGKVQAVWLRGLFAWIEAPAQVDTPVFVYDRRLFAAGQEALTRTFVRRPDLVSGKTGDPAFDDLFAACIAQAETRVPEIGAALRAALLDLRVRTGAPLIASCSRAGIAIGVLDPSRRLFEPRLLAPNDAGELRHEAATLAAVADVATRIAAARRAPHGPPIPG